MLLQINQLSKTYPNGVKALDDVTITIEKGMFGLLGPNGAGKSSLMRTIATMQDPDMGDIHFDEINVLKDKLALRKTLGYLPQEFGVYPRTSAEKLLDYLAQLKGVSSKKDRNILIDFVLEITNLESARKKNVSSYSGGMKQRFGIAQMLLNNPKLIIVDEPTAGLDPAERQRFLNILREISTESIVIFSTHIVGDISELCTDMAILNKGRILKHLHPETAINEINSNIFTIDINANDLQVYEQKYKVLSSTYNRDNSIKVRVHSKEKPANSFLVAQPNLEDYYFNCLQNSSN